MILNALTLYINLYKPLFINYGYRKWIVARLTHLSLMVKVSIPYTSMPEVVEMVAYLIFLSHLLDKSLSSLSHSRNCHVIEFGVTHMIEN